MKFKILVGMTMLAFGFSGAALAWGGFWAAATAVPGPTASHAQSADNLRFNIDMLRPGVAPVEQWHVTATAVYRPLNPSAPGASETTRSRSNCHRSSGTVFIPLPNFEKCVSTHDVPIESRVPSQHISVNDAHSINIDMPGLIDKKTAGLYRLEFFRLELKPCAADCETQSLQIPLDCYAVDENQAQEMIVGEMRLAFLHEPDRKPETTECGLAKSSFVGGDRDAIKARIRGHFGESEHMLISNLLDSFSAIPTPDNRWVWNPTAHLRDFQDFCPLPHDFRGGYDRADYSAVVGPKEGWPEGSTVQVYVYGKPGGELCSIELDGNVAYKGMSPRKRVDYGFVNGNLIQVNVDDGSVNVKSTWRWVDGQPMEYIHRRTLGSVAGDEDVLYWHKLAAQQWPALMDYHPDMRQFATLQTRAAELRKRFPLKTMAAQ